LARFVEIGGKYQLSPIPVGSPSDHLYRLEVASKGDFQLLTIEGGPIRVPEVSTTAGLPEERLKAKQEQSTSQYTSYCVVLLPWSSPIKQFLA
jgi:hypothetical protein